MNRIYSNALVAVAIYIMLIAGPFSCCLFHDIKECRRTNPNETIREHIIKHVIRHR